METGSVIRAECGLQPALRAVAERPTKRVAGFA